MPYFTRRPSVWGLVYTAVFAVTTYGAAVLPGVYPRWVVVTILASVTLLCPYIAFRPSSKQREQFRRLHERALDVLECELGYRPNGVTAPRRCLVHTQPHGTEGYVPFSQLMIFSGGRKGQAALSGKLPLGRWSRTNTVLVYRASDRRRFAVQMGEPTTQSRLHAMRGDEYAGVVYLGVVGNAPKCHPSI